MRDRATSGSRAALTLTLGVGLLLCASACPRSPDVIHRAPPAEDEKIIFVVVDALRHDHLSIDGYGRDTSPTIDRLAGEGLYLANLIVHSSQTVPSVASMLTAQLPHRHGIQFWSASQTFTGTQFVGAPRLAAKHTTLAEILHTHSFRTAAVIANPWLRAGYGFGQGFDEYVDIGCHVKARDYVCDGRDINHKAMDLLEAHRSDRLFLYLHYMDVHNPYRGNEKVEPRYRPAHGTYVYKNGLVPGLSATDLDYTMALYDEKIRYLDGVLADLVQFIEDRGLTTRTTVVVTSDHGDEFHEHGGMGHGTTLYNELINSFAVFWSPARIRRVREPAYTQAVDLLPTLLDLYELPIPKRVAGESLLPAAARTPTTAAAKRRIVSELGDRKALIVPPWKLIVGLEDGVEEFHFVGDDSRIEGPPRMPDDDTARTLREDLQRVTRRRVRSGTRLPRPLEPTTAERLRALGYIE